MDYRAPKGTFDIVPSVRDPEEAWRLAAHWQFIEQLMRELSSQYGYHELRTPIFESLDLFQRSVGTESDIVNKEMFAFTDRGGRSMALRPEGTAAAMRAILEHRLYESEIKKFFYIGPMFRYDRPQAGRYRQFHHFGIEAVGSGSPYQDVEAIDMLHELCRRLQLQNLTIYVNSVGDAASRAAYLERLRSFLEPQLGELSADSQARFHRNVLRILDSKDPKDRSILEGAPSILDSLTPAAQEHFNTVCTALKESSIPYVVHPRLVRGLDYYNQTVFEVVSGDLGAQNSIAGGGRYDQLAQDLGGPALSAVGFAIGLERLLQTMQKQRAPFPETNSGPVVVFIALDNESEQICFRFLTEARHRGVAAEMCLGERKVARALERAANWSARYALVIGETERQSRTVQCREMATRTSRSIPWDELPQLYTSR